MIRALALGVLAAILPATNEATVGAGLLIAGSIWYGGLFLQLWAIERRVRRRLAL